jgi:hypothetical protein
MLVDFPLLATGKRYRVLRGLEDLERKHLIAGMEPLVLGLEYNSQEQRLAFVCQIGPHIAHRFFFPVVDGALDEALVALAEHFEAVDTHVREPLAASAAAVLALAEEHRTGRPELARAAYRQALARFQDLEATAPNPASAASARQSAEQVSRRLASLDATAN